MTEGNGEVRELPKGWCFTTAIEACIKVIDCHNKTAPYIDSGIKLVRTTNIRNGSIDLTNTKFVDQPTYEFWSRRCPPEPGDILFTREAPMAEVGMIPPGEKLCMGQRMMLLRTDNKNLLEKYLLYALQSPYIHRYAEKVAVGTGVKHMRVRDVELLPILVAPLNEQHRIVEKIEELFSDLDKGIESLKTAQKQLKVYRQAVLKWAFEGKLTEEWRKQHQSTLKTGEALLAQIKTERENRYQQQLAEWEEKGREWEAIGKVGKKPTKPRKPKEPTLFSKSERPLISSSWCWVKLEDITDDIFDGPFGSNLKTEDYVNEGIRVIRLENIEHLNFDNSKKTFISKEKYRTLEKHTVYKGDIIFSSFINEEIRATILPNLDTTAIAKADCFCIRNQNGLINQKWLVYLLSSRNSYNQLIIETHGFTRPRINTTQLKQFVIPLCPSAEQEQIVEEIESRLSTCDQLETTIIENLQKAEALRQSILKQAFEGKLVPQDPNDEPAEKLLERIKAEREATQPKTSKQLKIKGL